MMEGWEDVRLDEISNVIMGLSPKGETYNSESIGTPLLNGPTEFGETYPNCTLYTTDPKRICKEGDLIFCVRGSTTGRMNWADKPYALGRGVCSITGVDRLSTKFIKQLLTINLTGLLQITGGGTFPNLRKEDINGFKFNKPKNYRKIASILSAYDDLIENNLKRIKLLEEQAQQTYEEWFVRFKFPGYEDVGIDKVSGLPVGWEKVKLGEFAKTSSGGTPSKQKEAEYYENGEIPWVKTGELKNFMLIDSKTKITELGLKKSSAKLFPKKTVLLAMYGNTIGETTFLTFEASTNQACCGFLVKNDTYKSYFLHQFLLNQKEYILNFRMGAAQENISQGIIQNIKFNRPSKDVLLEFEKQIAPKYDLIEILYRQNHHLKEARDILLPRLMSGIIDVDKLSVDNKVYNSEAVLGMVAEENETYSKPKEEIKVSQQFKDAVLLAMHVNQYATPTFTLSTYRYTKFSYLYRRFYDNKISDYKRKAAGPYNEKYKYKGPLAIALKNRYIKQSKGKYKGFEKGENINEALSYAPNYWDFEVFKLVDKFRYKKDKELETITTIDNAILNLKEKGILINLKTIKQDIGEDKDWKHKLEQDNFSDENIIKAKNELEKFFKN